MKVKILQKITRYEHVEVDLPRCKDCLWLTMVGENGHCSSLEVTKKDAHVDPNGACVDIDDDNFSMFKDKNYG